MRKIIAALAITVAFASCKKETVKTETPVAGKKISQISYVYENTDPETDEITYDSKGRILTHTSNDYVYNFTYESNTRLIVTSVKRSDNTPSTTYECTLNDKGAITQQLYMNAGSVTYTYEYTYNSDNYMTGVKGFYPNGTGYEMKAEIVNGNITTIKHYSNGALSGNSVYYYNNAKQNRLPRHLGGLWPSQTLFGKANAQLPTEFKRYDLSGTLDWHLKYTHDLDSDGDVLKETINYLNDGTVSVATYRYL
jgi:hypothetical protein